LGNPVNDQEVPVRRKVGIAAAAVVLLAGVGTTVAVRQSGGDARPAGALSPLAVPGRGAKVAFSEQEAETGETTGEVLTHDRTAGALQAEASGRSAVTLDDPGEYVEFTLPREADALTFRYSIPDPGDGAGRDAAIDVRVGDALIPVPLTSRHGEGRRFGEARTLLGRAYPKNTKLRLQVSSVEQSPSFTIDLADFELAGGPAPAPAGALDASSFAGVDLYGRRDSTEGLQNALDTGRIQDRPVYLPRGLFRVDGLLRAENATLIGAGPWHTTLAGRGAGLTGDRTTVQDLAVRGDETADAVSGPLNDSVVQNVFLQHTRTGVQADGPSRNLVVRDSRIVDQAAGGVMLRKGVTGSVVENTFVRSTGDDGLAMWSQDRPNDGNTFRRNTVVATVTGSNIGLYGGRDLTVSDNVLADTAGTGGGLRVANARAGVSGATAVSGTFTLTRNTLIRTGSGPDRGAGALWFDAAAQPLTGARLDVTATDLIDSTYAAIQLSSGTVTGLSFFDTTLSGAGTYALQIESPGAASFTDVVATGIAQPAPIYRCATTAFQISEGTGNAGWYTDTPACGTWPAPQWRDGWTAPSRPEAEVTVPVQAAPTPAGQTPATPSPTPPVRTSRPAPPSGKPAEPEPDTRTNVALGRPVTESGHTDVYPGPNVTDGDAKSYWEGPADTFPATVTVDLGRPTGVGRVVLRLPPLDVWETRSQSLTVAGSADNREFRTLESARLTFDPDRGNTATVRFTAQQIRYLRISISANTGWPAGQLSEVLAFGG
jgi:hypothetical protein